MSKMSCRCKDRPQLQDKFIFCCSPQLSTEFDQNALLTLENYGGYNNRFYRAMHFSAKRGIAITCRLSVCPSVCPSVCNVGGL